MSVILHSDKNLACHFSYSRFFSSIDIPHGLYVHFCLSLLSIPETLIILTRLLSAMNGSYNRSKPIPNIFTHKKSRKMVKSNVGPIRKFRVRFSKIDLPEIALFRFLEQSLYPRFIVISRKNYFKTQAN